MEFYLIRHGQTDWNRDERIQGWIDVGLNEKGRKQARSLYSEIPSDNYDLISSPLRRASETADSLADALNISGFRTLDEFRELDQGYWNGLKGKWLSSGDHPRYQQWKEDPLSTSPPNGESLEDVKKRVKKGLDKVKQTSDSPVLIVAHKVVNSLLEHLLGSRDFNSILEDMHENAQAIRVSSS